VKFTHHRVGLDITAAGAGALLAGSHEVRRQMRSSQTGVIGGIQAALSAGNRNRTAAKVSAGALTGLALSEVGWLARRKAVDAKFGAQAQRFSLADVNPTRGHFVETDPRSQNCLGAAIATDAYLAGNPAVALPGQRDAPGQLRQLEKIYGPKARQLIASAPGVTSLELGPFRTLESIEQQLRKAGDGARGLIAGANKGANSHVINVEFRDGKIRYLDGQLGQELPLLFRNDQAHLGMGPNELQYVWRSGASNKFRIFTAVSFMQTA